MVKVELFDILSMSFQLINLQQLFLKGVFQPLILCLQLFDPIQQLHLVALECGVLEDEALMLFQTRALKWDDSGSILCD